MSRLFTILSMSLALLVTVAFCSLTLQAQETSAAKPTHAATNLTGCLQKGDEAGGFTMIAADGKVWELHSHKVKLESHSGHKVTVTGRVEHQSKLKEAKLEKHETKEAGGKPYEDFEVSNLKMVSDSCN